MPLKDIKKKALEQSKESLLNFTKVLKWVILAIMIGLIVGAFGSAFGICMEWATGARKTHEWLIWLLPIAGVFIIWIYHVARFDMDGGTNQVLVTVHSENNIPFRMAPLIFIATVLTHLFGGSAGREGAALQIGGSFGDKIGHLLHLDDQDRSVMVMCGMSAAFSALFGTPMAAAIFPMEVITVGVMYYVALLPCAIAALVASHFASSVGISPESFHVIELPGMTGMNLTKIVAVAIICAFVSSLFCTMLHKTADLYKKLLKNPYVRVAVAGVIIIALTYLCGSRDYNGAGIDVIERAFEGDVVFYAFFLKMIFTVLTLGAGFRGGEIVPSFFVGATLGSTLGLLFDISPSMCAALGMAAVFCGVTNCPISTLLISFELFGYQCIPFYLLTIAISYVMSGYTGLYHAQKIMYSKYKAQYINRNTK